MYELRKGIKKDTPGSLNEGLPQSQKEHVGDKPKSLCHTDTSECPRETPSQKRRIGTFWRQT